MSRNYFGTDGVRGRVGDFPITPDFVMRLGYSAGRVLAAHNHKEKKDGERPSVLIGKDTRISGYMLEAALEAGFLAAGVDVCLLGPIPTPAVAYLTRALRQSAGVVISASHNPYYDNGIKFFSAFGTKLDDSLEAEIEAGIAPDAPMQCVPSAQLGKARRINDANGRYIEFCKSTFPNDLDLRGLKIVVDCAHGAAYDIAPHVLHELGAEVISIGAHPNGLNINKDVGATHTGALSEAVQTHHADVGLALDGDADRIMMADASGRIYDGDQLLLAIVKSRLAHGKVQGVVGTLMTNLAFEHALAKLHIPFARAAVGDRYILEMLTEKGWLLGGENSGHILCLDKHTTGDGLVSALQVLSAMRQANTDIASLLGGLTLYPQLLINVPMVKGFVWESDSTILLALHAAERALSGKGRVLLRASGTEPLLRVMIEGDDLALVKQHAEQLADAVRRAVGH